MRMKTISKFAIGAGALFAPAMAIAKSAEDLVKEGVNKTGLDSGPGLGTTIGNIVNAIIYIIGILAVLMIIIGALRMVLSGGNPAAVKSARETVLYAVVGLIIAIAAYGIVRFVFDKL